MSIGLSFIEHEWSNYFPLFDQYIKTEESNQVYMLAKMACKGKGMEISYGIATLNALTSSIIINTDRYNYLENCELLELWKEHLNPGIKIGMVGNMYPLVKIFIKRGCDVIILDKHAEDPNKEPLPKEVKLIKNIEELNDVDILIVSGSSLIYHSTEGIIKNSKNAYLRTIIGPTVTLPPEPFWKRGVNYVGGAIANTSYLQLLVAEELRDFKKLKYQYEAKGTLKFGDLSGIKKIGFLKDTN